MASVHETAYPRLKRNPSNQDLSAIYTPTKEEIDLAQHLTRSPQTQLGFLVLLKTYQRLGYAINTSAAPVAAVRHIATLANLPGFQPDLAVYDRSPTRYRHLHLIRGYLQITKYGPQARKVIYESMEKAAWTKHELPDLINVAIEELVHHRCELPAFTALDRAARQIRQAVTTKLYEQVNQTIGQAERIKLNQLFVLTATETSLWNRLKEEPGQPLLSRLQDWIERLEWLTDLQIENPGLKDIPTVKIKALAAEAQSLDVARMKELTYDKRYTLALALLSTQYARTLDDIAELFIKRVRKLHHKGAEALSDYRRRMQARTDEIIDTFLHVLLAYDSQGRNTTRFKAVKTVIGDDSQQLIDDCEAHLAYVGNNYFPFLKSFYRSHRAVFFRLLEYMPLRPSTQDQSLIEAIEFIKAHRSKRGQWIPITQIENKGTPDEKVVPLLDISWVPEKWRSLITGSRQTSPLKIHRVYFELCVFSHLSLELQSGDMYIPGSNEFGDYFSQLISWEEYQDSVAEYGQMVNLPTDGKAFVQKMQERLRTAAKTVDQAFPKNEHLSFKKERLVIHKRKRQLPEGLAEVKALIERQIKPVSILDVLGDTEEWLNWTRCFGPLSGFSGKLTDPVGRYLTTTFCYGCNIGPSQLAKSLPGTDRRHLSWIHHRHMSEEKIQQAIVEIIDAYNRFSLPKVWGSGKHASVDGTKWDIYEQNLLAEYHIRYGGYGGIGYYHISDTYIALFSNFIPCGVWEAIYILDGLLENTSEIQPDTIHGDTQAQSSTVFALAFLLGITLMPRIRGWQNLAFYRPSRGTRYQHLDSLFTDVTDWDLIETYLPDMLRVALSIKAGKIQASTVLRKLGTNSRKNKLYQTFNELGGVLRTIFLLQYMNDPQMQEMIHAETNKCESFNRFIKWLAFGGEDQVISSNNRDEQRKRIKYNHLVANCLIFYNVSEISRILNEEALKGRTFNAELLALLSPYLMDHLNRFGLYQLDRQRNPPPINFEIPIAEKEFELEEILM